MKNVVAEYMKIAADVYDKIDKVEKYLDSIPIDSLIKIVSQINDYDVDVLPWLNFSDMNSFDTTVDMFGIELTPMDMADMIISGFNPKDEYFVWEGGKKFASYTKSELENLIKKNVNNIAEFLVVSKNSQIAEILPKELSEIFISA